MSAGAWFGFDLVEARIEYGGLGWVQRLFELSLGNVSKNTKDLFASPI